MDYIIIALITIILVTFLIKYFKNKNKKDNKNNKDNKDNNMTYNFMKRPASKRRWQCRETCNSFC